MSIVQNLDASGGQPPQVRPVAAPNPVVLAYQQFVTKPEVQSQFHKVQDLIRLARSAAMKAKGLPERAAEARVEAGRRTLGEDPDERKRFSFKTGVIFAAGLAIVDAVPAFLAAQAFGADLFTTLGIGAVLVAALAAGMWAVNHYRTGWQRWVVITALGVGLIAIGALRWWYLVVTANDETSALLQAVALTVFTALLVGLGVVVLSLTKSRKVSQAEEHADALNRESARAARAAGDANDRVAQEETAYLGRAQLFAAQHLDDPELSNQFLEHVRTELEKASADSEALDPEASS